MSIFLSFFHPVIAFTSVLTWGIPLFAVLGAVALAGKLFLENRRLKKCAEKKAKNANELFRLLFETNPTCCAFYKKDGTPFDCNTELLKLLDLTEKKELLDYYFDFCPKDQPDGCPSADAHFKHVNAAFETGTYRFEWMFRKKTGESIPTEVLLLRSDYRNEKVVVGYIRDMREFQAMLMEIQYSEDNLFDALESVDTTTRKLHRSESQLRAWISSSNSPILIVDRDFRIVFVNETFRKLSGFNREELIGAPSQAFFDELDLNQNLDIAVARRRMEEGKIDNYRSEIAFRTKKGQILWGDFNATAVRDTEGRLMQIFIVYLDITDRLKMMQDLDHARIVAEEANEAKSRFLAIISHELRTPMNGIIGLTDLILNEPELPPKLMQFAKGIRNSGKSLDHHLKDILEFANLGTDYTANTQKLFDIQTVVESVLAAHLDSAQSKNLELSGFFATDIPKVLIGDEKHLRQILHHLLGNGIKFTRTGNVQLRINRERLENQNVFLRFCVHDTGVGMSEEELAKAFDVFYMADDSYSRSQGGLGIGLPLVRKIVDTLDGTITLESPGKDQGTTVVVVIPFRYDADSGCVSLEQIDMKTLAARYENDHKERSEKRELRKPRKRRVLIVEDNRINQMIASEIMKNAGYEIVLAKNGLEACDAFSETITPQSDSPDSANAEFFDVILMDCQMPTMDGFEATERIREMERNRSSQHYTPIIALTANTSKEDEQRCMDVGMNAFCTKPVDAQKLLRYVEKEVK